VRDLSAWSRGAKEPLDAGLARDYLNAGATWWLEDTWRKPSDEALEHVRADPPG
jgi:hypothetical protein